MGGSKRLIARLIQNTTILDWELFRPTYFPTSSFSFPNLATLKVRASYYNGYLSLQDSPLWPTSPMRRLETLDLAFQHSYLLFAPVALRDEMTLAHFFPNLTYLSIAPELRRAFPAGWPQKLPPKLSTLKLLSGPNVPRRIEWACEPLNDLPKGLTHLEMGSIYPINDGKLDLALFQELRFLSLHIAHWSVILSPQLPNTLEVVKISVETEDREIADGPAVARFKTSKLPPRIRVWNIDSRDFYFEYDIMVPPTLEEFVPSTMVFERHAEKHFHFENFKVLHFNHWTIIPLLRTFPNLEDIGNIHVGAITLAEAGRALPPNLKSLSKFFCNDQVAYLPLDLLPRSMTKLGTYIWVEKDILALPRTLTELKLEPLGEFGDVLHAKYSKPDALRLIRRIALPSAAWKQLPPNLKRLKVDTTLFSGVECLSELSSTLETLKLVLPSSHSKMWKEMKFDTNLQLSLKTLHVIGKFKRGITPDWIGTEMSRFSSISTLLVDAKMILGYHTLSLLPPTLTSLTLRTCEVENFGAPQNEENEVELDWSRSAFSRLPAGLHTLDIAVHARDTKFIDCRLFSRLPEKLACLTLTSELPFHPHPEALIEVLPRRLARVNCKLKFTTSVHPPWPVDRLYYSENAFWTGTPNTTFQ